MYAVMRYSKRHKRWVLITNKWSSYLKNRGFAQKHIAYKHLEDLKRKYPGDLFKVSTVNILCLNCEKMVYQKHVDHFGFCRKCRAEIEQEKEALYPLVTY